MEACIRGWYWNHHYKPNQLENGCASVFRPSDSRRSSGTTTTLKPVVESIPLRDRITSILSRNLSASELTAAFVELSVSTGRQLREIKELAADIEADEEIEDGRSDRASEINRLHHIKQRQLTLSKYLPLSLADPMTKIAEWMGAPPAAFLVALLPTVGSLLDPATQVIIKECIGFIERPIIYAGIVTESGQRKSPIINAIADPLRTLQQEEDARFRQAMTDYEEARRLCDVRSGDEPPPPPRLPREYYIDKATMEAVDAIKQNQPNRGLLWLKDELSGLMASYGEYKNGRGSDKESVLSGWNGRGVKKNLKGGERVSLPHDAMSVFGAIQDATLQKKMGDFNDDQGDWARFLWLLIPLTALKLPESDTSFQLAMLENLYRCIDQLAPQTYRLAFDAQRLYDNFHWQLEQRRVAEPRRGMRAAIAKMEGYTARLALLLHLIWEVEAGEDTPTPYIPKERVEAACKLAEFFLGQVELIHTEGAAANGNDLTPRLSAVLEKAHLFGELTARKVQSAISWLRKVTAGKIRNDFKELAKLGYGVCIGNGNRLKFVPKTADSADSGADGSADSPDSLQALNLTQFQDFNNGSADSADITQISPGLDAASGDGVNNSIDRHQHYQHNSSLAPNPDQSIPSATGQPAAVLAAEAAVDKQQSGGNSCAGVEPRSHTDNDTPTKQNGPAKILLCQSWVAAAETADREREVSIPTSAATMNAAHSNHAAVFQRGQQVRIKLTGSQRDGKTGVVRGATANGDGHLEYEVWLDDNTIRRDLRKMMCLGGWLEAIARDAG